MKTSANEPPELDATGIPEEVLSDLERLHQFAVPPLTFRPETPPRMAARRFWRPVGLAAAAVAGLALFVAAPSFIGDKATPVSAEQVIERTRDVVTANAPADPQAYRLVARSTIAGGNETIMRVWYQDAEHQRNETLDADGNVILGSAQDGDTLWYYGTVDGRLKAVRAPRTAFPFQTAGFMLDMSSLNQILEMYSQGCTSAELQDEGSVAGRAAHVVEITPDWDKCDSTVVVGENGFMTVTLEDSSAHEEGQVFTMLAPDTTMRLWVDQETYVTLKSETYSGEDPISTYEVLEFETGEGAASAVFTLPPGTEVIEADSPEELSAALADLWKFGRIEFRPAEIVESVP